MKKILLAVLLLSLTSSFIVLNNDDIYRRVDSVKFSRGEKLTYLIHYGFLNAGEAEVILDDKIHTINDRPCYRVDIHGKTIGVFGLTMKVDDNWRSFIDTSAIIPQRFYRNIKENSYRKEETVYFNHQKGEAIVKHTTGDGPQKTDQYKIPRYVQDMVSGYYYLRTLDFDKIKVRDTLTVEGFFEDKVYNLEIVYLGKERLSTKFGKIQTAVISPVMPENQLFAGRDAIKMWISDDENRVPVRVEFAMFLGAFSLDLIEHKGLRHKFRK
jgi:hypothetical protein